MYATLLDTFALIGQQSGGGVYRAGQIAAVVFVVVLVGAILWKFLKK